MRLGIEHIRDVLIGGSPNQISSLATSDDRPIAYLLDGDSFTIKTRDERYRAHCLPKEPNCIKLFGISLTFY